MDLNDDRFVQWIRDARPDALAFPTNWVLDGSSIDVWRYWAWRLRTVDAALVAANTWGTEERTTFTGRSVILRAHTVHGHLPSTGDGVVAATLPPPPPGPSVV